MLAVHFYCLSVSAAIAATAALALRGPLHMTCVRDRDCVLLKAVGA